MKFSNFIKDGKVVVGEPDIQKAKSLIKMSEIIIQTANMLEINEITSSTILTNYYESLRQILEAICLLKGYKVYSHEAYVSYLRELKEEKLSIAFDRFRKLRNGVNYYGEKVPVVVSTTAKIEIKEVYDKLKEKYLKEII